MTPLLITRTSAVFSDRTKAMGIVHKEAESILLFVCCNLFELALVARHAKDAFGHHEDATTGLVRDVLGAVEAA